ncbi:hypothetical protein BDR04DRAFT_1131029 [Suillus decipiens]|nr:hypothetical protein BDR04DRAFT_1131029 [Suillus decipiens]
MRFRDVLPQPPPTVPLEVHARHMEPTASVVNSDEQSASPECTAFCTPSNIFGLVCQYFSSKLPSHNPEEYLGNWYWNQGVQKSQGDYMKLMEILSSSTFKATNLSMNNYDKEDGDREEWEDEDAGWKSTPVSIQVPFLRTTEVPGPQLYHAANLYHCSIIAVLQEKLANARDNKLFHYEPYELRWDPPHLDTEVSIYGDLYMSAAFHEAHSDLQKSPGEPDCDLPRVVAGLMFWSDATQLTSFGNAKLWPTYMYFSNESKYCCCKPLCNLSNHIAYFETIRLPTLPDSFKDLAGERGISSKCGTHCHQELSHQQWRILLDNELLEAYEHGIVICCCDGIKCRFYPRIFTYSADYPEKVLIATVRNLGGCPCPRCLIPKDKIQNMGRPQDKQQCETLACNDERRGVMVSTTCSLIYEQNFAVGSTAVERILKPQSWVPTSNAFSDHLRHLGVNIFRALIVDLLHKFELGVWKMLFIHLLYRQTPMFGAATIRKFSANSSEMKHMAAQNFEDLLQCSIPIFDGLLPELHNHTVLQLLFTMAHWHGLAKLRMHSDLTLQIMDQVTSALGQQFCHFKATVCAGYVTHELRLEVEHCAQHLAKQAMKQKTAHWYQGVKRCKVFNFQTYKFHTLGDYVSTIRRYGTSDSFSTELGELEHHSLKARYSRTDRRSFVKQLTRIECHQAHICHIGHSNIHRPHVEISEIAQSPLLHHHIGLTQKHVVHIGSYLIRHQGDPAITISKLKHHILHRINSSEDLVRLNNEHDINTIIIKDDQMYEHHVARFNYMTYDVFRAQDIINPRTSHHNVMVLSSDLDIGCQGQRYIYGRVLGVYHVNVIITGRGMVDYTPIRVEFLWIHWYNALDQRSDWLTSTLDRVNSPPLVDEHSFDFIDPADVLCSCHIIPCFNSGKKHEDGFGLSACAGDKNDWHEYYVNQFVDHDMLMHFHFGLGVGHAGIQQEGTPFHLPLDVGYPADDVEVDEDDNEDDNEGTKDKLNIEHSPSSSKESLLDSLDEMYDSEVDLDYEN